MELLSWNLFLHKELHFAHVIDKIIHGQKRNK